MSEIDRPESPARTDAPGLGTLTMPETEARPVPRLSHGDGDHERFAHYAPKDKIVEASVMGTPITALCGKVWVPSRDPKRFPVCPECKDIYENVLTGGGEPPAV
ncbi:MAG TPA: DUF3039 domain-containing protein [Acidothermaceae bacterium]